MIAEQLPECCAGKSAEEWQRGVTAGRVLGYADALDAAREAVAAVITRSGWLGYSPEHVQRDALAAIDALRGDR